MREFICSKCGQSKDRYKGNSYCKACRLVYLTERYDKNRDYVRDIKEASPCMDCGVSYPAIVMDFDHRGDKSFSLAKGYWKYSIARLLEEIKKCDLVCSNCHRIRTFNRANAIAV